MAPPTRIALAFVCAALIAVAVVSLWLYRSGSVAAVASAGQDAHAQDQPIAEESSVTHSTAGQPAHTNRLSEETSPYLLQHAHNPVDWYPWGEEALAKAKEENKPIFLSVGYSACHWCHVMERESFENDAVAAILNENFISIKVDREERPDIDEIYMAAVQAMTGSGGWPMSVFLTPDLKPFYGGTYFPPEDAMGRPGFKSLLNHIAKIWREQHDAVQQSATRLTDHVQSILSGRVGDPSALTTAVLENAVKTLSDNFDRYDGGFGGAPKFPSSPSIELLLRAASRSGDSATLNMATTTLDKMMRGGIYDHLGGGFARYSVDAQWLVPHFEKMLYDNAQLAKSYLEAYQLTGDEAYRRVAEETLAYILRDMTDASGGFYSAEDADSEGEEGKFYVWEYDEIVATLGEDDAKLLCDYYGVLRRGNFPSHEDYHKGENILYLRAPHEDLAREIGIDPDTLRETLAPLRAKLLDVRSRRVRPGLDDKILTSWNALMITALAKGYEVLGDAAYRDAAVKAARFILDEMTRNGELLRTHRLGESRLPGYLDDYAYMADACVDLYEATFDPTWLDEADTLATAMIAKFWDADQGGFYFTSDDHKNLIVRTRPTYDGAVPSGNSVAAMALLRLAKFRDNADYDAKARAMLEASHTYLTQAPQGFMKMMLAADFALFPPKEIALVGPRDSAGIQAFFATLRGTYVPNKVLAFIDPSGADAEALGEKIPLLKNKRLVDGAPAAYVCENYACKKPATQPDALLAQLKGGGNAE